MDAPEESTADLIRVLQDHGDRGSDRTLARRLSRWHRVDLLPPPVRRSLGRGRGTVSIYPRGTTDRLRIMYALPTRTLRGRLLLMDLALWWAGDNHYTDRVRQLLREVSDAVRDLFSLLHRCVRDGALTAVGERLARRLQTCRGNHKLRQWRKRVGRTNIPTHVFLLAQIASGSLREWADHDDLAIAVRFKKSRSERRALKKQWQHPTPLPRPLLELILELWGLEVVETATDRDVEQARDRVRMRMVAAGRIRPLLPPFPEILFELAYPGRCHAMDQGPKKHPLTPRQPLIYKAPRGAGEHLPSKRSCAAHLKFG